MKELFLKIQEHIGLYLEEVDWIDLWNNQLEYLDKENPIPFPAIFIEFLPISWLRLQGGKKRGELRIRIHVVQESYSNSHKGSRDQLNALELLDYATKVDNVFENFNPDPTCYTSFQGVQTDPDVNHGNLIDIVHEYTTSVTFTIESQTRKEILLETAPALKDEGEFKYPEAE